jgi:hypothetical protein
MSTGSHVEWKKGWKLLLLSVPYRFIYMQSSRLVWPGRRGEKEKLDINFMTAFLISQTMSSSGLIYCDRTSINLLCFPSASSCCVGTSEKAFFWITFPLKTHKFFYDVFLFCFEAFLGVRFKLLWALKQQKKARSSLRMFRFFIRFALLEKINPHSVCVCVCVNWWYDIIHVSFAKTFAFAASFRSVPRSFYVVWDYACFRFIPIHGRTSRPSSSQASTKAEEEGFFHLLHHKINLHLIEESWISSVACCSHHKISSK